MLLLVCASVVGALKVNKEQLRECSGLGLTDIYELIITYCSIILYIPITSDCFGELCKDKMVARSEETNRTITHTHYFYLAS